MQSLALLEVITPFFQRIFCSCSQAFWSRLRRQILIVIETTYASRSNVMIAGKYSSAKWLVVVDQTCDNPIELGTDYIGVWEKLKFQLSARFNYSHGGIWTLVVLA